MWRGGRRAKKYNRGRVIKDKDNDRERERDQREGERERERERVCDRERAREKLTNISRIILIGVFFAAVSQ